MDEKTSNRARSLTWAVGLVAAGAVAGGIAAATAPASAQTSPTPSATAPATPDGGHGGRGGPGGQRADETLLTGTNATKAKDAALKAVPGATIDRVETDADGGGVYEAHVTKADGTRWTVTMDKDFKVTGVTSFGHGGPGPGDTTTSGTAGTSGATGTSA
jgi:hypothetical protein